MAIDPSIPLQTQSFDMLGMLGRGSELAKFYAQQKTDGELNRIYNESQGDLTKMLDLGKQSKLARFVVPQIESRISARNKSYTDQLKDEAEIAKTSSEAFKNNQQGQGYGVDNSQKKFGAIQGVFQSAAMTGDKGQVLLGLDALKRTGTITPEDYAHQFQIVKEMKTDEFGRSDELKQYASGIGLGNKDVAPYLYQSKNNAADNATSAANNMRTTNASIYSTDVAAQTAAAKLVQDKILAEQELAFKEGQIEQMQGQDGITYAYYKSGPNAGKVEPMRTKSGEPFKAQPKNGGQMSSTAQKELFETTDAITAGNNAITNLKDALKYSSKAYDGVGASQRAGIRGMIGGGSEEATATAMLDNITTGNALEQLKATFGGAPTEGERAILLQLQGSANMPRAQREAIYTRALEMAEIRIKSNQEKAESLRSGSFFKPDQVGVNNGTALDSYSFMP